MKRNLGRRPAAAVPFFLLVFIVLLAFLLGGGSREDIVSLVILRPSAFLVCAYGLWTLSRTEFEAHQSLFVFVTVLVVVIAAYLLPLPPALWQVIPGRELVAAGDRAADLGALWRPLSLEPLMTWNALFSLSVPFAVLLLAGRLSRGRHMQLIAILIVIGLASGLIGVFQVLGAERGALYFYRITNPGAAVGLFANRNHHAIFLATLLPMLAVFASTAVETVEQRNRRLAFAFIAALAIIAFILNTGSRSGLVVATIASLIAWRLFRPTKIHRPARRKARSYNTRAVILASGIGLFGMLGIIVFRGQSFQRLVHGDDYPELRIKVLGPIMEMARMFFPFGSGPGAFAQSYQIVEPTRLLSSNYLNHAHNDWLEVPATMGIPGIGLLAFFMWIAIPRSIAAMRNASSEPIAALGAAVCGLLALASIVDYPLRTPSIMVVFTLALVWMWTPRGASDNSERR